VAGAASLAKPCSFHLLSHLFVQHLAYSDNSEPAAALLLLISLLLLPINEYLQVSDSGREYKASAPRLTGPSWQMHQRLGHSEESSDSMDTGREHRPHPTRLPEARCKASPLTLGHPHKRTPQRGSTP